MSGTTALHGTRFIRGTAPGIGVGCSRAVVVNQVILWGGLGRTALVDTLEAIVGNLSSDESVAALLHFCERG